MIVVFQPANSYRLPLSNSLTPRHISSPEVFSNYFASTDKHLWPFSPNSRTIYSPIVTVDSSAFPPALWIPDIYFPALRATVLLQLKRQLLSNTFTANDSIFNSAISAFLIKSRCASIIVYFCHGRYSNLICFSVFQNSFTIPNSSIILALLSFSSAGTRCCMCCIYVFTTSPPHVCLMLNHYLWQLPYAHRPPHHP